MSNLFLSSESEAGFTSVSDIFIDEYVPSANGEFVKVYLYLLRLMSCNRDDISISSLADRFNQTEADVMRALRYWDKLDILKLSFKNSGKELCGITIKELHRLPDKTGGNTSADISKIDYLETNQLGASRLEVNRFGADSLGASRLEVNRFGADSLGASRLEVNRFGADSLETGKNSYTPEKLNSLSCSEDFTTTLYVISTYYGRSLTENEINSIIYFYDALHFSSDLIHYLFEYCLSKNKSNIRYIEKVALSWAERNITTVEEAKLEANNHNDAIYNVMKAFGIKNRELGKYEQDYIIKWTDNFSFNADIIAEACNRTIKATHQPSFEYADSILSRWKDANISSTDDIRKCDAEFEAAKSIKTPAASPKPAANKFNSFQQRNKKSDSFYNSLLSNNT